MNTTPETDAEANNGSLCDQCVPAEFARKLERERDANRAVIETQKELIGTLKKQLEEAEAFLKTIKKQEP